MTNTNEIKWSVEKKLVKELILNNVSYRVASNKFKKDLKKSLQDFGLVELPVVNLDGTVIAGTQRVSMLMDMGQAEKEIFVVVPSRQLTSEECLRYSLSSNRIKAEFDLSEMKGLDVETLIISGFDDMDLSNIFDESLSTEDDKEDAEELVEEAMKNPRSKLDEMYQLGNHVLLIADSTKLENVEKLMGGKKVDTILTDPLYAIDLSYAKGVGKKQNYGGKADDSMTRTEYKDKLIKPMLENALLVSKKDVNIYVFCDQSHINTVQDVYEELNINFKRVCLYLKNGFSPTPNVAYQKSYEPCVFGVKGKPFMHEKLNSFTEIMNKEISTGNKSHDDIYDMFDIWMAKKVFGSKMEHPTQKPISLYEKPLRRTTKPGDVVLDLFGGSGSLLLACEQLKRKCYMMEIDPVFADVIINRFEKLTNAHARKIN
jgi:DNA modification methylase